jgi:hypothetical protein
LKTEATRWSPFPLQTCGRGRSIASPPELPLDTKLYQDDEDDEALLLGLSVGSGVVENGGTRGMPVS